FANALWKTGGLWTGGTGTSYASPQGAGAAALLMGSGISDPLAVKAILVDSARPGRATPTSPMGTQTGWQPDWGWGELNLDGAFAERTNFATAEAAPDSVRLYAGEAQAAGDRATIVWNRRTTPCLWTGSYGACDATPLGLT